MPANLVLGKNATTLKSEGYSVRIAEEDGKIYFATSDLMKVCGHAAVAKRVQRFIRESDMPGETKVILFPFETKAGHRKVRMNFVDYAGAKAVIHGSQVSPEALKWLEEDVLTYNAKKVPQMQNATIEGEPEEKTTNMDDFNRCIDRILIELLELKKLTSLAK